MEAVRRKLLTNPREKANIISILFFWWTLDIFKRGYSKVFGLDDLFQPLAVDKSERLGDRLEKKWNEQLKNAKPSLWRALFATFWREYMWLGCIVGINEIPLKILQPLVLGELLLYFRKNSTMTYNEALAYACVLMTINMLLLLLQNQVNLDTFHIGMKVRVAVCSLIYRKALRLSQTALGETAPGKIVNLLSNDVSRFEFFTVFIHHVWTTPISTTIIAYLLWVQMKWAGLIGLAIVIAILPIQLYSTKYSSRFRMKTAVRTDERIRLMDEITSGIKVIKMYAWEMPFSRLLATARKFELNVIRKSVYLRGFYMIILLLTTRMAIFFTMLSIVLLYSTDDITASKVFTLTIYFNFISQAISQMFSRAISETAEIRVGLRRLENFLKYEEGDIKIPEMIKQNWIGNEEEKERLLNVESDMYMTTAVSIRNATARWTSVNNKINQNANLPKQSKSNNNSQLATIENVHVDLKKGQLIGIIGPVGAGKSSLFQAMLRELPLESGSILLSGSISYASQVPWVFAASARQNILFGEGMDRCRFDDVIQVCALTTDFEELVNGEKTIIGERGASLSGGQRARINLARAVYRMADIYLLDDPLSAVDSHVGRHLFNECIGPSSLLAKEGATRILITHQLHFLKEADWIIVLKDGKVEFQGEPKDLSKFGNEYREILEENKNTENNINSETEDKPNEIEQIYKNRNRKKSVEIVQQLEASSKGKVHDSIFWAYLRAGGSAYVVSGTIFLYLFTQFCVSAADYWVAIWISQEELRRAYIDESSVNSLSHVATNSSETSTSSDYFDEFGLLTTKTCITINACLVALMFLVGVCRSLGFYELCVRASKNLHKQMTKGIIRTTMHFFDTNPSGRILNRFSKDMGAVDELLPKLILDAGQIILTKVGTIIVIAIVNPIFLVPILFLCGSFVYLRKIFLKTSTNVKRLEGMTRSPVFTHISASLGGLATIRAFNAQKVLIDEFDNHQDLHSACCFSFLAISAGFGICLDLLCFFFVICVTYYFLLVNPDMLSAKVGLAISQVISLSALLQWGVRQSAEVVNQLMSVERIMEYQHLVSEKEPQKPRSINKNWPNEGKIEFRDVSYRYFADADPVLHNLNFIVRPNEKIGIVGRTGAGKSSLIGAIFRMAIIDGKILIDNVDTSTISLKDLRSKVAIIPQDPVLFSGTLRRNLDPFEEFSDAKIWLALEEVELKDIAEQSGLQTTILTGGSNLSVGQRQLLCLARAILRNNRVLVLDEATANVDPNTDNLIQRTIRTKFADCTILTVAHRLNTIIDSDRVIIMNFGKIVEFDTPHRLLQDESGVFRNMVYTLGPQESERLIHAAHEKYDSMIKIS